MTPSNAAFCPTNRFSTLAINPSHNKGSVSWSGNNRVRRSMPASDTRKHVNSTAPKPRHPNPNCHTHASTSSIVANSTSGYCAEIGAWQCRHLPRNTSQLKSGMFSYHDSLCLQCGQCEGSTTIPGGGGS